MSKKVFSQSQLFHSPLAVISNLALSAVLTFFFHSHFRWLAEVGFGLNIPIDLSHYLCLRVSHWVVPHWSVATQFTYVMRLWSTELVSQQAQWVGMPFTFHPYLMQTASTYSCLVHTQSLWLPRLTAKKMPIFSLLFLWVVVTQGSVPLIQGLPT